MVVMGDGLWTGEAAVWLWLLVAIAAGCLVWLMLPRRWRQLS
jgi:hypothetical protein